jgi:hypothetical protein
MQRVVLPELRDEALALVRGHQAAGDQVVIVTATNEFVTRPIAQAFGVSELIAVALARGADGWITGEIDGVPSAREGKVTRVEQWLAAARSGLGHGAHHVLFRFHQRPEPAGAGERARGHQPRRPPARHCGCAWLAHTGPV